MANKKTIALTEEQFHQIIKVLKEGATVTGGSEIRPNRRVATILSLEAVLGLRISDILLLTLESFVRDGDHYRLDIEEEKTGKSRTFEVDDSIMLFITQYCNDEGIKRNERIFAPSAKKRLIIPRTKEERQRITKSEERGVQKVLKNVCDYLELENVSTHSFRKFFATSAYKSSDGDIAVVQELLQHASPVTTRRYINVSRKKVKAALKAQAHILQ